MGLSLVSTRVLAQNSLAFQSFPSLARQLPLSIGKEEIQMLYYALIFLVVGLIAGALGLFGVAAVASVQRGARTE